MPDALVAWLRDVEELRSLPQRYARAIDARDIDGLALLFHPDGVVDGMRGSSPVPAYIDGLRDAKRVFESSMHVLGDPLVMLEPGVDEAQMDTYAVAYQMRASGAAEGDLTLGMRYLDAVVRHGGSWRIRHRRAINLWTRGTPPA